MKETLARRLEAHRIVCLNNAFERVQLGFGRRTQPIRLEPFLELREGVIDADAIGAFTYLGGSGALFRHIERIGRFCAIAGGIQTGQVEHPTDMLSPHAMFSGDWSRTWPEIADYYSENAAEVARARAAERRFSQGFAKIAVGNDVWIGYGALIRRGVSIGDGAVIGARAVVTRDVPPYTIVAGVPAVPIRRRFPDDVIARLLALRWWDYGLDALRGVDVSDMPRCVDRIERNVASLEPWTPPALLVHPDGSVSVED